ncbi:hypothetical protein B0H13DRAFT_358517 [Mycena leptocephala]|nr:hypothetical protein B0H13DRAFT_358517 [Mycena leptocephala]
MYHCCCSALLTQVLTVQPVRACKSLFPMIRSLLLHCISGWAPGTYPATITETIAIQNIHWMPAETQVFSSVKDSGSLNWREQFRTTVP